MLVIGHRGSSAAFPENTVAAFEGAIAQGADGVELDVRRTADGALAVAHDEALPDGRRLVDLQQVELPPEVPILPRALDACRPLRLVNIEIKNWPEDGDFDPTDHLAVEIVSLLEARGELDDGRILVSAFHLPTVDRVRELAPTLATGWLVAGGHDHEALVDRAAEHGHTALHPHHAFVNEALVTRAHEAGLQLNTWTCDDPDRIRWLASIGVDGVVTNAPDVALSAMDR